MNIQVFFQKKREVESTILRPFVVVMSLETSDGGKAGRLMEVSKSSAARIIVEGRARLATEEESTLFEEEATQARSAAEQSSSARFPVAILSEQDLRSLRNSLRTQKS